MDDDMYPNDSSYFLAREPQDQIIARKKEKAQTLEAMSVLEDVVKRLETRIDFYERHSNIPDSVRVNPEQFLIMSNSHTLAADALRSEMEYLVSLMEAYGKK